MTETDNQKMNIRGFLFICISMFFSRAVMQMQSTVFPLYIVDELGLHKAVAGMLGSAASVASIFMRPFIGALIDKGKAKYAFIGGAILFTISVFFSGWVTALPLLFLFRFTYGAGQSVQTTTGSSVATQMFPESRMKEGLGYFGLTWSVSQAFGAVFALALVAAVGFQNQFFITTAIMIFSLFFGFLVKIPEKKPTSVHAEEEPQAVRKWWERIIEPSAITLGVVMLLTEIAMCTIGTYLPIRAAELEIGNIGVFFTVQAVLITGMRMFGGRLTQGKREIPAFIASLVIIVFTMFGLYFATKLWHFIVISAIYGFANGNVFISIHTMIVMNAPKNKRGMAHSTYYLSNDVGAMIGMTLWGVVADIIDTRTIYLLGAFLPAIALMIFLRYIPRLRANKEGEA